MRDWIAFQIAGDRGPALVFLHGIGGDAAYWQPQLDAFASTHRAIAWDMPGYGDSPALDEMNAAVLADALEKLLDRLGIDRAHLVGHGLGGMIGIEFTLARQHRVRSLTLVGSGARFGPPDLCLDHEWRMQALEEALAPLDHGASLIELAPRMIRDLVGEDPDPGGLEQAILSLAAVSPAAYRGAFLCQLEFDRRAELATIAVPTLLIAGSRDRLAGPGTMSVMHQSLPQARLAILEGAGHLASLERPALFNQRLAEFLRSIALH